MERIAMDPTLKNKTISRIKLMIPEMPPRLKTVAKYIVDHTSDFGLDPIRETARKCGVSTYTLVRMAKTLGFNGYEDLRKPFRQALVSSTASVERPEWINNLRAGGELGEVKAAAAVNTIGRKRRTADSTIASQAGTPLARSCSI